MSETADQPEVHAPDIPPPWGGGLEITQGQLLELNRRRFEEDYRTLLKSLFDNGSLTVIPDP